MARPNKLYEKPRGTTIASGDLMTYGELQADGSYKVKTITRANEALETLTYAQLEAKVTASTLVAGNYYLITNATDANINLLVQAVSVNAIHSEAKSPQYEHDIIYYDFTNDVITWRWDSINDISCGADFRNSNDISVGTNCEHIDIGGNPSGITIGNNCTNITIGNSCSDINISNSSSIVIGNNCEDITTNYAENIKVADNCTLCYIYDSVDPTQLTVRGIEIKNNIQLGYFNTAPFGLLDGVPISWGGDNTKVCLFSADSNAYVQYINDSGNVVASLIVYA